MPTYRQRGRVPKKRLGALLGPDGALHADELIGDYPLSWLAK